MRRISLLVPLGWLLLMAGTVRADLLAVGAGSWSDAGTGIETWNRVANPAGSANITIPVFNNTPVGSQTVSMTGWALSIEIVPQAGATGSLTIASVSEPSNNALSAPDFPSLNTIPVFPSYQTVQDINGDNSSDRVPTSGANLVNFNVTSLNHDAVGTFNIVAFNVAGGGDSNWTFSDGNPFDAMDVPFTNLPGTGPYPNPTSTFTLGTITVLGPTSVPEPGSMVLAGIAAAGFAGCGWRRKRRPGCGASQNVAVDGESAAGS